MVPWGGPVWGVTVDPGIYDDDDDVYINKLQREVLQNLWSEYTNNIDQPIWHK
jgi:hypothetical protein